MYTIYEIPGVKVGCTNRSPEIRVKEQGYNDYRTLEVLEDLSSASQRERYWQEKLGYIKDRQPYTRTLKAVERASKPDIRAKVIETRKNSVRWKEGIIKRVESYKDSEKYKLGRIKCAEKLGKPIIQYDLSGNFIKEWPSIAQAAVVTGYISGIKDCAKGRQKTAGGFIWKYKTPLSEIS
jgi:hypothetical protein